MSIRNHSHATKFSAASRLLLVGASLLCTSNAAAAGSGEAGSANTAGATSVHEFIGLPIVYAAHSGTEFDGRHAFSFDASRVAHLPKLSGGFGVRPTAGVLIENLLSNFGASAAIGFEYTNHQAISYNVDDSWYAHENARLYDLLLQFRGFLELANFKPFIGITPGYVWLSLPQGITVTNPQRYATWSDVTLRGFSLEASAGLLYEIIPLISADASFGYVLRAYNSSGAGSLSGFGLSPGWDALLGLVLKF